jgi:hypothetical protein
MHINIQSKAYIQNSLLLQYSCTKKYRYIYAMAFKDQLVPSWIDPSLEKKKQSKQPDGFSPT